MRTASDLVHAWRAAYNDKDFNALSNLLHAEVVLAHHGQGSPTLGREAVVSRLSKGANGVFPNRRFAAPHRITVGNNTAVIEYDWEATASRGLAGVAEAGQRIVVKICAVLVEREGLIFEYTEYG